MQQGLVKDKNDYLYSDYGIDIEALLRAIYEFFGGQDWDGILTFLGHLWNIYSVLAILLSLLFIVGFVYAKVRYSQLSEIEQEALRDAEARWATKYGDKSSKNQRWEAIEKHVSENSPESWRIAIIEADILLEETLNKAGYVGKSLGEKLKTANPISFTTVQDAWEAHKVRNEIAHVGSDFVLTKKNAQETIVRYGRVFKEFGVI